MYYCSTKRLVLSTCSILYIWILPLLALIGFAEPGSQSISAFIANPHATGAMAAISFMPFNLMWEYQDIIIHSTLYYSLTIFQIFYGIFLICTLGYVPYWVHIGSVVVFGTSYLYHAFMVILYIQPNLITTYILMIGSSAYISLLFVPGMWFWFMECVALTAVWTFTPIDWYLHLHPLPLQIPPHPLPPRHLPR